MTHWINATGGAQRIVADGPHRIEQTATSPIQQSLIIVGFTAGQTVTLGSRPQVPAEPQEVPKFESKLA